MPEYQHQDGRRVTPTTPQEAAALTAAGFRPATARVVAAPGGTPLIRSASPEEQAQFSPDAIALTPDVQSAIDTNARGERLDRDAESFENQVAFGASALAADVSLNATTAAGFDARSGFSPEDSERVRQRSQGTEAIGHIIGAVSPAGAEALIMRGTRWIGSPVARLAAEGAAGGTFNALQEAAIARDPDVFAERFMGDLGIGALLGAGLGVPFSAASGLRRLARGTSAARANRQLLEAADGIGLDDTLLLDGAARPLDIEGVNRIYNQAVNPQNAAGRAELVAGGAARPRGPRAAQDMRGLDRVLARRDARLPHEIDVEAGRIADGIGAVRRMEGALAELNPNAPLPTRGLSPDAVPHVQGRLARLGHDLGEIATPNAAVASALRGIREAVDGVAGGSTPQQLLRQLYDAPRAINRIAGGLEATDRQALDALLGYRGAAEGTSDLLSGGGLRSMLDNLDEGLVNGGLFGDAGKFIKARREQQRALQDVLEPIRGFDNLNGGDIADPNVLRRIIQEAENSGSVENIRRLQEALAEGDLARGRGDLFPELRDIGRRLSGESPLDEFMVESAAAAMVKKIGLREQDASKGVQQGLRQILGGVGIAAGAVAFGPAGALVGGGGAALLALARSPFGMARMAARVRNAMEDQGVRLGRSLDSTTSMGNSTSRTPFLRNLSPRTGTLAASVINGSPQEKAELYEEIVERIQALQDDPMAMAANLVPQTEVIGEMIPGLNTAAGMQGHRQLSALAAALPLSARTQAAITSLSGPPALPSATAINEFLQVASVVEDPIHGIDLMNTGRLSRGSAAALATAFPNFHEEVTARIISDIAKAAQRRTRRRRGGTSGPRMNYQASLMMSRFVGFPLDATMEAGFQSAVTSQAAQTNQQDSAQFSRNVSTREPSFLQNEQVVTGRIGN